MLLWLLTIELAVLAVTGVILYFVYRPSSGQAWVLVDGSSDAVFSDRLRIVHRLVSVAVLPTGLAAAVLLTTGERPRPWVGFGVVKAAAIPFAAVAAGVTGYLLAWDQVALWAVTVGTNLDGFEILTDDDARFVLIDGVEVGVDTILRWLMVHVGLGLALVALTGNAWLRSRAASKTATAVAAETEHHGASAA